MKGHARFNQPIWVIVAAVVLVALVAFSLEYSMDHGTTSMPMTTTPVIPPTPAPAATSVSIPTIPETVAVALDSKTTALLILDITSSICTRSKSCLASVPAIASLLKKARGARVLVVYSHGRTVPSTILPEVAPEPGDPIVVAPADKFFNTNLDDILKQRGIKTVVIVGTSANGAVLYTAFGANVRGYIVVVAEDGMSTDDAFAQLLTSYQLLHEPGFSNPANNPLAGGVTLSRTDLITFR